MPGGELKGLLTRDPKKTAPTGDRHRVDWGAPPHEAGPRGIAGSRPTARFTFGLGSLHD